MSNYYYHDPTPTKKREAPETEPVPMEQWCRSMGEYNAKKRKSDREVFKYIHSTRVKNKAKIKAAKGKK